MLIKCYQEWCSDENSEQKNFNLSKEDKSATKINSLKTITITALIADQRKKMNCF